MDEEFYQRHLTAVKKAETASFAAVAAMKIPSAVGLAPEVPNLGYKINAKYVKTYTALVEKYPDELEKLVAIAIRQYWLACWKGANYFKFGIELKVMGENAHTRLRSTAAEYSQEEGGAGTLYNEIGQLRSKTERAEFATEVGLTGDFEEQDLLLFMALFWLHEANAAAGSCNLPFDLIHEAYDAFDLVEGQWMWNAGYESGQSDVPSDEKTTAAVRSAMARAGALARRDGDPKNAAKAFVKSCWEAWQGDESRYEGKAAFARDMLDKQSILKNQKVIEDWCRIWEKQAAS